MKAMLLAAGVGSRLDPLTTQIPKPLVPVANVPVIEHILALLKHHGFTGVIANLHYLPEKIAEHFDLVQKPTVSLHFKHEKKLTGDAGGVRACRDFFDEGTFLVIMGDLLTDCDLTAVVAEHKRKNALASIALKRVDDVSHFGVAVTKQDNFIYKFQEKPSPREALSDLASTGIYVFEPEIFKYIPGEGEYGFGRQLFPKLIELGLPVLGVEITSYWSDVGTISQYKQSNFDALVEHIALKLPGEQRRTHSFKVWTGENSLIDQGCFIEGYLMLGNNSRIGKGTIIKGHVVIGDNCVIGERTELIDSVVWSNTTIESDVCIRDSVIGLNCHITPGTKHINSVSVTNHQTTVPAK